MDPVPGEKSPRGGEILDVILLDGTARSLILCTAFLPGIDFLAFDAILTVTAPARGCPDLDTALPYGTLDSNDTIAFVAAVNPALAAPGTQADMFDLLEFLRQTDAGCP